MLRRFSSRLLLILSLAGSAAGQTNVISTYAGGGPGGPPLSNNVASPWGVAVAANGDVYFAASGYGALPNWGAVYKLSGGAMTLVAGTPGAAGDSGDGGPATKASVLPYGLALDGSGNVYIAASERVRKVAAGTGVITTVAGNGSGPPYGYSGDGGQATNAGLNGAAGVAIDTNGNLYIADSYNNRIRKVAAGTGVITTMAGNGGSVYSGDGGRATDASLNYPNGVAVDSSGNVYIADTFNGRIRKVTAATGAITTVAGGGFSAGSGDGGPATGATLNNPYGVAVDDAGNVFIAERNRIRKVAAGTGVITTVAGSGAGIFGGDGGPATAASLADPHGVAVDRGGNVYIADSMNNRIRRVAAATGVITTVAGNGSYSYSGDGGPATGASLDFPFGVALDDSGNLYIADSYNERIRKVAAGTGLITTVAGSDACCYTGDGGPATSAGLSTPSAVAVDGSGNLFIADSGDNRIRKVAAGTGVITTVAGNGMAAFSGDDGPATGASLGNLSGLAVDASGNIFIPDGGNNRVRKVAAGTGVITTVAGNGTAGYSGDGGPATSARLQGSSDVALDSSGNLYIADAENNRVRKVAAGTGVITTVAGNGAPGYSGDGGPATSATLVPNGVAADRSGNLYIVDADNYVVRRVAAATGVITTVAGNGIGAFSGDGGPATSASLSAYRVALDSGGNLYIADSDNNRVRKVQAAPPVSSAPTIAPGGVVSLFSSSTTIQPGSWFSIFGTNLASGTLQWNSDFPTSLGGTSVSVNGKPAYLWFVSAGQINAQAPDDTATGSVSVVVTTAAGTSNTATVTLAAQGPSFSLLDAQHAVGIILTPDGSGSQGGGAYDLLGPSSLGAGFRPAKKGEAIALYGVGFGPTTPNVPAGSPYTCPRTGCATLNAKPVITLGGIPVTLDFGGIIASGLYQFNFRAPSNAGSGEQALLATVNGVQTQSNITIPIQ